MDVYLEVARRRVFAGALAWPGWCRSGRDEASALEALIEYRQRYAMALGTLAEDLPSPADTSDVEVVERLVGGPTTDFGAPGEIPTHDEQPPDRAELDFLAGVMEACWTTFDRVAERAYGEELAPAGARGGGRSLDKVRQHVFEAEASYLATLGGKAPPGADSAAVRRAFLDALGARARGELPATGPRGGRRWPARYAARRAAWHVLDHAWEIEDRLRG